MEEIQAVHDPVNHRRIFRQNLLLDILLRPIATYIPSLIRQLLINDTKATIDTLRVIEQRQVHDGIIGVIRYLQESKTVAITNRFGQTRVELRLIQQHLIILFGRHRKHGLMNGLDRRQRSFTILPLHLRLIALLDLHRWNGHIRRILPVMLDHDQYRLQYSNHQDRPFRYTIRQAPWQLRQGPAT